MYQDQLRLNGILSNHSNQKSHFPTPIMQLFKAHQKSNVKSCSL